MILVMIAFAGVNAQSCCAKKSADAKSCSAKATTDAKASMDTKVASMYMEADKIADADDNIQKRVCAFSGSITYYQKIDNSEASTSEWVEVSFDKENKKFTRVASAIMVKDLDKVDEAATEKADSKKACCTKSEKACCKKSGV
jgi:hypothetical protein